MQLDDYAYFNINEDKLDINIGEINREKMNKFQYTKKVHLENFYKDRTQIIKDTKEDCSNIITLNEELMLLIVLLKNKTRYFILDKINDLIFIPLVNKHKNIIDYGITELKNLNIIQQNGFYRFKNKYVFCGDTDYCKSLHEIIFGKKAEKGYHIDHINGDRLDNRTSNLREITISENSANRIIKKERYMGISKDNKKWRAQIRCKSVNYYLGAYVTQEEAAKQYDIFSVHLFPGIKKLNQIDGKDSLTKEEIDEIKNNPKKYDLLLNKKKERELPKNIYISEGHYFYNKMVTRTFITKDIGDKYLLLLKEYIPEIQNSLLNCKIDFNSKLDFFLKINIQISGELDFLKKLSENVIFYLKELDEMLKNNLTDSIDEFRNDEGIAVIKAYDGKIKQYVDVKIDDSDWKIFIHYKCSINKGYPIIKLGQLHNSVFERNFPEEYKNRNNKTIDHRNRDKNDVTLKNLILATQSLQCQNRDMPRNSLIKYTGVHAKCGSFYAKYKKIKKSLFKTVEEAAEEYNKLALEDNKNSRINIIPNTKTTILDIYSKENLLNVDINLLENVGDIKEIIRTNGWKISFGIGALENVKSSNINIYKNKIINELNKIKRPVIILKIKSNNIPGNN